MVSCTCTAAALVVGHNLKVSFQLLLSPYKESFCPSWPDHTRPCTKKAGFVSVHYSADTAQILQQCASGINCIIRCCIIGLECYNHVSPVLTNHLTHFFHISISLTDDGWLNVQNSQPKFTTFEMWIPFEGLCSTCSFITKGSFKQAVSHRSHLLWLKQNMM